MVDNDPVAAGGANNDDSSSSRKRQRTEEEEEEKNDNNNNENDKKKTGEEDIVMKDSAKEEEEVEQQQSETKEAKGPEHDEDETRATKKAKIDPAAATFTSAKEEDHAKHEEVNGGDNDDKKVQAAAADVATGAAKKEAEPTLDAAAVDDGGANPTTTTAAVESDGDKETITAPEISKQADTTTTPKGDEKEASAASKKNPYESLRYIIVRNDGKPESMIKLIGLKSLFAKQLPKMPRAYIARLVLDRRHTSLAILANTDDNPSLADSDEEIIGGICYRAFPEMRFAEIAFCAVNAKHQVKGYGTKLMNLLKKIGAESGIEYYITYADNYAIGYFKKQGFTKTIQMPKGRYLGLIKDYDGGTPMECYVHPSIDFTRIPEMLQAQKDWILSRIALHAQSRTTVYPPLPPPDSGASSTTGATTSLRGSQAATRALAIPGITAAGWTLADVHSALGGGGKEADKAKAALKSELLAIVRKIEEQAFAWPFREPVDTAAVPDYLTVIKEPIDLSTIEKRIRQEGQNYYRSKQMLFADLMLMVNNCKLYNDEASTYVQCAVSLENFVGTLFRKDGSNGTGR